MGPRVFISGEQMAMVLSVGHTKAVPKEFQDAGTRIG